MLKGGTKYSSIFLFNEILLQNILKQKLNFSPKAFSKRGLGTSKKPVMAALNT
jgi:hypothetical protein